MDPQIYRRWDQMSRRSKHPLLIGHTRREPSFLIMNAKLSTIKVSTTKLSSKKQGTHGMGKYMSW
jgi:hypothetical protein